MPSKKRGRPPLDPEKKRGTLIHVMATEAQHQRIRNAAEANGFTMSSWLLALGLDATSKTPSDARTRRLKNLVDEYY